MLNFLRRREIKKELEYLKEMRPLPMGRVEFERWSREILRLAEISGLTLESAQFALSEMILHIKPTQSFESYGHFVHSLRKGAANQVAHTIFTELKEAQQARAKEKAQADKPQEVKPKLVAKGDKKVLENSEVQSPKK